MQLALWLSSMGIMRVMATFVHLTSAAFVSRMRRTGIKAGATHAGVPGVHAMPVVPNYFTSHQWTRELRKWGRGVVAGIYFRVPDTQLVWIGRYSGPHQIMTAAQAVATIMNAENAAQGYEIIIPHKIDANTIRRIRLISSRVGWRHFPGSHQWSCLCPACTRRGEYGARRRRAAYEQLQVP